MNYEIIENLNDKDIISIYEDVITEPENIATGCCCAYAENRAIMFDYMNYCDGRYEIRASYKPEQCNSANRTMVVVYEKDSSVKTVRYSGYCNCYAACHGIGFDDGW